MNPETAVEQAGRTDDAATLRLSLGTAPPDYLRGALDNPALGPDELVVLLVNRSAPPELLARIGRTRSWLRSREIKRALVCHPKTPAVVSRGLLPHLFWRELAEVAAQAAIPPVVRREAEKLLRLRLPQLSLGERVTLGRLSSRGLIPILFEDGDAAVLRAVAGNPRATEGDLARVLALPGLPAEFLAWLAERSAWSQRGAVRLALVAHGRTPPAAALRLVRGLTKSQLRQVAGDESAPRLVRVAASRRLGVDTPSDASLQSPADRRHPESRGLSTSR